MTQILSTLQTLIQACLVAEETFYFDPDQGGIPVLTEQKGDLSAAIAKSIAKLGAMAYIDTPTVIRAARPLTVNIGVTIVFAESPIKNRAATGTQKTALDATLVAWALLDGWRPPLNAEYGPLVCESIQPMEGEDMKGMVAYALSITAPVSLSRSP